LPADKQQQFIELFIEQYQEYFKTPVNRASADDSLTQIIDDKHHQRLLTYIKDAVEKGAIIHKVQDNAIDSPAKLMQPILISNVTAEMSVMKNEIFGTLLPILSYENFDEAIAFVNNMPRPLALYMMSNNALNIKKILYQTHSGGVCINDTLMHIIAEDAPFGGIGQSGMGHYHGEEGFRAFSKAKTVVSSAAFLPKNKIILKYREKITPILKAVFFR
jgi:coniferyl-aldehyde dehydrogenase